LEYKFELADLRRIVYWTICKFRTDEFHHSTLSWKRDLIGGFLDRWVNRATEFVVFKNLLSGKNYYAVTDFFFYGQATEKNAPDVIGLQDKNGKILARFVEYVNGKWVQIDDAPWIEVKTCRKTQKLVAIKESQMEDDHYYAIVESNIRDDYLTAIFDKSVFDNQIFESFHMNPAFVKSDAGNAIVQPEKIVSQTDLGFFKLIGIFKGSKIKMFSKLCRGRTREVGAENPRYVGSIEPTDRNSSLSPEEVPEGIFTYTFEGGTYLPILVKYLTPDSKAEILTKSKGFFRIAINGKVAINEHELLDGFYKVTFKTFNRNTSQNEWITHKCMFERFAENSEMPALIKIFDKFAGSSAS